MKITVSSFKCSDIPECYLSLCHEYDFLSQGRDQQDAVEGLIAQMYIAHVWWREKEERNHHSNPWNSPFPIEEIARTKEQYAHVDKREIEVDFDDEEVCATYAWVLED